MLSKKRERSDYWLNLIDQIIQKRFHEPDFNVNALAAELGISPQRVYEIVRIFRKTTPQELIESFRMEHGKNELLKNRLRRFEIASECGYVHYSTFLRTFKRKYGMSPTEYGKMNASYSQKNQEPMLADIVKMPIEEA
ncbi:helix-turn-helix transcriptional regulator [bacterium]|nr:helix-turn-helix transcriptional regulator [bacterium]